MFKGQNFLNEKVEHKPKRFFLVKVIVPIFIEPRQVTSPSKFKNEKRKIFSKILMSFGSNSVGMGSRVVAEIFPHCHSMASGAIAQFPLSLSIVCSFYFIYLFFILALFYCC